MRSKILTSVCLVLCIFQVTQTSTTFRLQRDVIPTSYSLRLEPDIDGETFEGEVTVFLKVEHPITNVTLNSEGLEIHNITLDQAYESTKYALDAENQLLHVFFEDNESIDPGEHLLNIKYTGAFGPYVGFYKIESTEKEIRPQLATKFSPNHARMAFPCFDEPFFKTKYSIRLVKPNDTWEVISNMREINRFEIPKGIAVDFESTIPMSTYLLSWIYTYYPYEKMNHNSGDKNITLRFYNEEKGPELREALKNTEKALGFFENYTDIPFPLAKLDSITLPFYRSRGMEHYGLIVYQDHAIFKPSPFSSKLYHAIDAALLICHEMSHMWFGNLVTHQWYNDIWLTEGFARYMQYKAGVAVLGQPFVKYMFQESKFLSLFQMKCFGSMTTETASYPRRLNNIWMKYGTTTYDQGGALLLMLEDIMGEDQFRKIVKDHLKIHQYGCSTTGEFVNLVDTAVPNLNLKGVMESYLFQNKLPLVNVTIEGDFFVLRQSPLCGGGYESIFGDKWSIPIRYITSSNRTSNIIRFDREMSLVRIPKLKDDRWIQINHLSNGLYRSVYSREIYKAIGSDFEKLNEADVGPFIEDAFFMLSLGKISCDIPMKLIEAVRSLKKQKIDFLTYTYISRSFSFFSEFFDYDPKVVKILRAYFIDVFREQYDKVSWKVNAADSMNDRLLRMVVLESFCLKIPRYHKCYEDMNTLKQQNVTVHEDVGYIYKALLKESRRLNSSMIKENMEHYGNSLIETNTSEHSCIPWIQQNVPKLILQAG